MSDTICLDDLLSGPSRGLLIVISGPSGTGKGAVLKKLFKRRSGLYYSISATTRAPRPGEVDGVNYYFLETAQFERQVSSGEMLEYAKYCGNYYGTPRAAVEKRLGAGEDVVLEIEVQGAESVKKTCPDCVSVFILPPSCEELERRLRGRGTESDTVIRRRLNTALEEISRAPGYDYIVINDEVEAAAERINSIITAEKLKTAAVLTGSLKQA